MLIEANAQQILDINPWPPRQGPRGINGSVEYRTYGLMFTITMQNFAVFLQKLMEEQRYFNVDHFYVHNKSLRNPGAPLQIQMLLTQARYIPAQQGGSGPGIGAQFDPTTAFTPGAAGFGGGFGGGIGDGVFGGDESQLNVKPTLMRRILNLFPF